MGHRKPYFKTGVQYFRLPSEIGLSLPDLTGSELQVYVFFLYQAMFRNTLDIKASYDEILLGTSIKTRQTLSSAIKGLAEKGWIGNIIWESNSRNTYCVSLKSRVNINLLPKMHSKSQKISKAKLHSLRDGEKRKGKFVKGNSSDEK